jgi:hypothetical protein
LIVSRNTVDEGAVQRGHVGKAISADTLGSDFAKATFDLIELGDQRRMSFVRAVVAQNHLDLAPGRDTPVDLPIKDRAAPHAAPTPVNSRNRVPRSRPKPFRFLCRLIYGTCHWTDTISVKISASTRCSQPDRGDRPCPSHSLGCFDWRTVDPDQKRCLRPNEPSSFRTNGCRS